MRVAICTRNNPIGLAACIGAIYALAGETYLHISDASDSPVLDDPTLSRLLAMADGLYYEHTTPNLPHQRRDVAKSVGNREVLFIDDDVLLFSLPAMFDSSKPAMFGFKVDLYNDRGYPDFAQYSEVVTPHSFPEAPAVEHRHYVVNDTSQADNGLVYTHGNTMVYALDSALALTSDPWIADNLAARFLAGQYLIIADKLRGWHLGNKNNWWKTQGAHNAALVDKLFKA